MTNSVSDQLLAAMAELQSLFPDWRMGQLVANLTQAAGRDREGAIWDVEDSELLAAARRLIDRNRPHRAPFAEHGREVLGFAFLHLSEMLDHVSNRNEPVLDIVIHLSRHLANGGAPFGVTELHGACAQSTPHDAEAARERSNLVVATARKLNVRTLQRNRLRRPRQRRER